MKTADNWRILQQHRAHLQLKKPAFKLFEIVEKAGSDEGSSSLVKATVPLVEIAEQHHINVGPETCETAKTCAALPAPLSVTAMEAWAATSSEAVNVSRRTARFVFTNFGCWLKEASDTTRPEFLKILPRLAPVLRALGDDGIKKLLRGSDSIKSDDARALYWEHVADYASTHANVVLGIGNIGRQAYHCDEMALFGQLVKTMIPRKLMATRDGQRLIPAITQLSEACRKAGKGVWKSAFRLIYALDSANCAARHIVSRDLPKTIRRMQPDSVLEYLDGFRRLVDGFGIFAAHFGQTTLPDLYVKHGPERTRSFVEAAVSTAQMYGPTAGWSFLDQNTPASREMLT